MNAELPDFTDEAREVVSLLASNPPDAIAVSLIKNALSQAFCRGATVALAETAKEVTKFVEGLK